MKHLTIGSMKERTVEGFGKRLAQIRKSRGLSQSELGQKVKVTKRVIAYYEDENAQPPGSLLIDLSRALAVSADELLGIKPVKTVDPRTARILKRVKKIESLPPADQRAIFKFIDALLKSRISLAPRAVEEVSRQKEPLRKVASRR